MKSDERSVAGAPAGLPGEQVVQVQVGEHGVCLSHDDGARAWCLPAGWRGLLAARGELRIVSGMADCAPLAQVCLVKLQVFIDLGVTFTRAQANVEPWACLALPASIDLDKASLEPWYLQQALRGGGDYQAFAEVLRQSPGYWLVRFLLEQGTTSEKLIGLARRYGVSVSHFRRLCHQALGGAAKPELRDWRTAKALLTMIRHEGSLTDVALEFGYASSSHFSKEVRELLGVPPSRLADITRLASR